MIRELAKFPAIAGLSLQEFRKEFEYLIEFEPPRLALHVGAQALLEAPASTDPSR